MGGRGCSPSHRSDKPTRIKKLLTFLFLLKTSRLLYVHKKGRSMQQNTNFYTPELRKKNISGRRHTQAPSQWGGDTPSQFPHPIPRTVVAHSQPQAAEVLMLPYMQGLSVSVLVSGGL